MVGPIIRQGFDDIARVQEGWREPKVNYVDRNEHRRRKRGSKMC